MWKKWLRLSVSWLLAVALAAVFVMAGYPKLTQSTEMVSSFSRFGYSAGFALLIGVMEALGGLLALIPGTALYGAGLIAVVMGGAIYTHLSTDLGSPTGALIYLVVALLLAVLRWGDAYLLGSRRKQASQEPAAGE